MFFRLLIIVFALSTLATPVMASCNMMDDADMSSMSHDMHDMADHKMAEDKAGCHIDQNHSCSSTECMTACSTNLPLMTAENIKIYTVVIVNNHFKDDLLSLYKIFLPINTPPPLV